MPMMNVRITADTSKLRVPFSLRGLDGHIDVSLTRNTDPDSLGYSLLSGGEPSTSPGTSRYAGAPSPTRPISAWPRVVTSGD